jgi:opacity protein-like surface antigen
MLRLSVMKQVIRVIFRVAGAVAFVVLINPLKSAVAEEAKVVPAATAASEKSSLPNSKSGWYVTAGAGTSWESSINTSRTSSLYAPNLGLEIVQNRNGDLEHGDGVAAEAGVGYDFGNRLRAELTYLFNTTSLGSERNSGTIAFAGGGDTFSGQADVSGRVNRNSVLASLYCDIPTKTRWVPYVGGGLGYTNVSASDAVYNYNVALGSGGRGIGTSVVPGGGAAVHLVIKPK